MITTRTTCASVLVAIVLLMGATAGCTGTEVLDSRNFVVSFDPGISNPSTSNFVCTTMTFSEVKIRPTDPLAQDPLGGEEIGLVVAALNNVTFQDNPCEFLATVHLPDVTLSSGDYEFSRLIVGGAKFHDGTTEIECFDSGVNIVEALTQPVIFSVGPGRANTVRFVMNEQDLSDDAINTFICSDFAADPLSFFTIEPQ